MSRNVWLKFDEWELINEELSNQKYHSFQLSQKEVNEWKKDIQKYPDWDRIGRIYPCDRKFERVGIYPWVEKVKSARALNILCREGWRSQDMYYVMKSEYDFIGFIITHCEDVNMDTTLEEWENIRTKMNDIIELTYTNSNKTNWWRHELVQLYKDIK